MAKIRDLKNEVNYLTYEIIADCNTFMVINPEKKQQVIKIVEQAVELRNELIQKINNPENTTSKYFRNIKAKLLTNADKMFEQLRALLK